MNKEECIKEFVKEAQFYEQHYARIDIRFVTDFLNKHLEIYAEAKAKEAFEAARGIDYNGTNEYYFADYEAYKNSLK